uniref:Uncharacterized protein n=1 Tax=Alexandrium andersonii TaxID=327968 RepID=A0A7S2GEB8_9DINO|mmetsp:Transcript_48093/g.108973  ORF Transcript_48093/g.108973 Transcript_48093/m.108973 type:complete len:173 (+) Transcript_48093:89-607(+)
MPLDYSKFDKIEDSDDEAVPVEQPAQKPPGRAIPAPSPAKLPAEFCTPLDDAPPLEPSEGGWLKYYTEKMSSPQRMQTMVLLWNSAEQEERVGFLRHLIDIIGNPAISNRIKGGQEVLKDLDASFYHGVTYPEAWVGTFKNSLSLEDKKVVFEKLYNSVSTADRGMVVGTLM